MSEAEQILSGIQEIALKFNARTQEKENLLIRGYIFCLPRS